MITRPRKQAAGLAEALERLGATVSVVPLIEIEPVALDSASVEAYDWIVFTSASGVRAVRDQLVDGLPDGVRIAAVGPATADACRGFGAEPSFVPDVYAAEEIAAGLGLLDGRRVLLPQADIASPRLAEELRTQGAIVDAVIAYYAVAVEPSPAEVAQLEGGIDAILLASGSAARSLARLSKSVPQVGAALLVCIGPKTADVARKVGLEVGLVAHEATSEGIIHALTSHFGENE